jgi:hypothetical protein
MAVLRIVYLPVIFASLLFGQHLDFGFDFGVKGGVPFTDLLQTAGTINVSRTVLKKSDDYFIGPVAELRIPFGFAIEVDGIYRGAEYHAVTNNISSIIDAHAWEIPYLAKFRFPIPLLKPFISAGGAYRTFTSVSENVTPAHNAVVLGGGLELRISKLRLSGEMRWLRWGSTTNNNLVRLAQNQGEVLFGLVF